MRFVFFILLVKSMFQNCHTYHSGRFDGGYVVVYVLIVFIVHVVSVLVTTSSLKILTEG